VSNYIDKFKARIIMETEYEWNKWTKEIPNITFKEEWNVKIIPPFGGAIIRFVVNHKEDEKSWISVYLDCYDELGIFGEPYWEIYPYKYEDYEDVCRIEMNNVNKLIEEIDKQLKIQISENIKEKVKEKQSKFYTYDQNNSGGRFHIDDNVCEYVIIEAKSPEHANDRAKQIGIYFDGVSKGIDCGCCGDRWTEIWDDDEGDDVPSIYGEPVTQCKSSMFRNQCIIYYLDGRKETVKFH